MISSLRIERIQLERIQKSSERIQLERIQMYPETSDLSLSEVKVDTRYITYQSYVISGLNSSKHVPLTYNFVPIHLESRPESWLFHEIHWKGFDSRVCSGSSLRIERIHLERIHLERIHVRPYVISSLRIERIHLERIQKSSDFSLF